tara:strand:- start:475 stop:1170 length:696 start_codon:yes stop_codon:yes gene_type:complete
MSESKAMAMASMKPSDLATALRSIRMPSSNDGVFLKFSKGDWAYGPDDIEPSADARFGVNPFGVTRGYIAWGDGKPIEEVMVGLTDPEVRMADLPSLPEGAKWSAQLGIELMGVAGAERGVAMKFSSNSKGGMSELTRLISEIADRAETGEGDFVPVVQLAVASYTHKTYGKVKTPVLTITDWCSLDDTVAAYDEQTEEAEPEAAKPTAAKPEPAPEEPSAALRGVRRSFK